MLDPYSAEDAALRAVVRNDRFAAQRAYAAMSPIAQRAYAAAHPEFIAVDGYVLPEAIRFAMLDAEAADGPDAAQALYQAHVISTTTARVDADRAASAMPIGERVIMIGAYTVAALAVSVVAIPTAYVAAGVHGALVAFTALACALLLFATYRLFSSSR